ncbi:hypothetical protein Nepgr_023905 [Nepenthes gracilis]|uniref:Uncharacterized protein n=1 Tax=Nepenthes gracilis TaxID=150966 RepID=A0AAD3XY46_NEPGR|nr:hypothetical protein Nepgr_023905 [Nepenthes gracilis]
MSSTLDYNQWIGCCIFLLLDGLLQLLYGLCVPAGALLLMHSCWLMAELAPSISAGCGVIRVCRGGRLLQLVNGAPRQLPLVLPRSVLHCWAGIFPKSHGLGR